MNVTRALALALPTLLRAQHRGQRVQAHIDGEDGGESACEERK
jgi:hypothetical protein